MYEKKKRTIGQNDVKFELNILEKEGNGMAKEKRKF